MKTILFMLLALTLLAGCAQPGGGGAQLVVAQSNKLRNANPISTAADQTALVAGNTAFAFDLYQVLKSKPGNLFLSPYSISTVLAISQIGARGETLAQMNKALHFTLPQDSLHTAFNALQLSLNTREQNAQDPNQKDFILKTVNAVFAEKTHTFLPGYLDFLAENYGLGLRLVDFIQNAEASRQVINQWVTDETNQRIKDLFPPQSFNDLTRLVIANAIYFNAEWKVRFTTSRTQPGNFVLLDGKQIQTPMMAIDERFNYYQGANYQVVQLPYKNDKISMLIVVPDSGKFTEVESTFNPAELDKAIKGFIPPEVKLKLPRFKFESAFNLVDALRTLGMTDAFKEFVADFSGMDGTKYLYISQVVHKTFISVDETGTEAAAATGLQFKNVSAPLKVVDLTIDRPFLFFILDKQSGSILFMGRVVNPE